MAVSRLPVALAAAFFATTASVWPSLNTDSHVSGPAPSAASASPFAVRAEPSPDAAWPPPGVRPAAPDPAPAASPAAGARSAPAAPDPASSSPAEGDGPAARMERTATGAHRLVVEQTGTFVHLSYREVASAGPDWAAIELRAGDRAPRSDVAVWESTDPRTLVTRRGLVRFSLDRGARPEVSAAEPPRPGPVSSSPVRTCRAHEDGASGFAVVCRVMGRLSGVRAIRPTAAKPLSGAWVWDVPRAGKAEAARFVRFDLPLVPGAAESGALAYVHAGKGVVVRADATWASPTEAPALLFTETSRAQPVSSFFTWR